MELESILDDSVEGDARKPIPAVIPSQGFWPENTQEPQQAVRGFRAIETQSVTTNDGPPIQLVNTQDLQAVQQNPDGQARDNFKSVYGQAYDPSFAAFIRNQQQLQMAIQLDSSANSAQVRKMNGMLMKKFMSE